MIDYFLCKNYEEIKNVYRALKEKRAEVNYEMDGCVVKINKLSLQEKFGYVDIQVMAGLTHSGFRLGVGPVAHILAHHTSDMTKMDSYNEKMRAISYGFSGSIGYDIDRFSFDVKYDKAFRSVGDHIYYGNKKSLFKEFKAFTLLSNTPRNTLLLLLNQESASYNRTTPLPVELIVYLFLVCSFID